MSRMTQTVTELRVLAEGKKRVGTLPYLFDVDPKQLLFTESDQDTSTYRGDSDKPILVYETADHKLHVIDGHHRTLNARKLGKKTIRAVVMPEWLFHKFQDDGIHQADMFREFARWNQDQKTPSGASS